MTRKLEKEFHPITGLSEDYFCNVMLGKFLACSRYQGKRISEEEFFSEMKKPLPHYVEFMCHRCENETAQIIASRADPNALKLCDGYVGEIPRIMMESENPLETIHEVYNTFQEIFNGRF